MLSLVKSVEQYKLVYDKYIWGKQTKNRTNYFVDAKTVLRYVTDNRLKYTVMGQTLFLFVEQGEYYLMFFVGLSPWTARFPSVEKDICCDVFEGAIVLEPEKGELHQFLEQNGFVCENKYEQVTFSYGKLHTRALDFITNKFWYLNERGLRVGVVRLEDKPEIERLIISQISKYDNIIINDEEWQTEINNENIVGIFDGDILVAFYYFSPKAGRILVKEEYRGHNLSVYLRMYFAAQARWKNSHQNQYDWVEDINLSSKRTFEKLGAVYTGKIKYRYIKREQ